MKLDARLVEGLIYLGSWVVLITWVYGLYRRIKRLEEKVADIDEDPRKPINHE